MAEKLTIYDPTEDLADDEEIAFFMADAFETGDAAYIAKAIGIVARVKGMTEIAKKTGLSREQLYRSFSERGNPTLKTTLAVMRALGIDVTAKQRESATN
jgi:probable addiction module antidote protein